MKDSEDMTLLREWARGRSETAFGAVVERYAGLVFGVALRRSGDRVLAEEAVQNVFTDLARKAAVIVELQRPLAAWLHRSAVYEAATLLRSETRYREKMKRYATTTPEEPAPDPWQEVRTHLDAAINALGESDRRVLLLHWFERRTFADIAEKTGSSTAAVQRRGLRALEKLAALLRRRGAVIPAAVLAAGLTPQLSQAAPAGLAAAVSGVATHAAPAAGGVMTFLQQTLYVMTSAKLTTAAVVLVAAAIPVSVQYAATTKPGRSGKSHATAPAALPAAGAPAKTGRLDLPVLQQALRRLMANADDYEAQLELRRFMFSLEADEIKPVLDLLMGMSGTKKEALYEVAYALFARWAELDPAAAAQEAFKTGKSAFGYYPLRGAFITWAHADLDAAWSWLEKTTSDPFDREFSGGEALAEIAGDNSRFGPVMARLDAMKDTEWRDKLRYWVARANPRPAVEWALALPEGDERTTWVPKTLELAGTKEPEYALRQLGHIENSQRRAEVGHNIVWPWLLQRPVGWHRNPPDMIDALENQVGTWPSGMFRDAGDALTRHDAATALATAKRLPEGEERNEFIQGMLIGVHYGDATAMLPALSMISEDELVHRGGLSNFTEILSKQNPRAAAEWITSLPQDSKVRTWADSTFKGTTGRSSAEFLTKNPQ